MEITLFVAIPLLAASYYYLGRASKTTEEKMRARNRLRYLNNLGTYGDLTDPTRDQKNQNFR